MKSLMFSLSLVLLLLGTVPLAAGAMIPVSGSSAQDSVTASPEATPQGPADQGHVGSKQGNAGLGPGSTEDIPVIRQKPGEILDAPDGKDVLIIHD